MRFSVATISLLASTFRANAVRYKQLFNFQYDAIAMPGDTAYYVLPSLNFVYFSLGRVNYYHIWFMTSLGHNMNNSADRNQFLSSCLSLSIQWLSLSYRK